MSIKYNKPLFFHSTYNMCSLSVLYVGDVDFTVTSGSITFQPSETQKSITIGINDDSVAEEMEHFFVQLSLPDGSLINETNVILGAVNRSVVNIIDSQDSNPCKLFQS